MAEPAEETSSPAPTQVAGFWRRVLAFLIDSLLLGVPALIAGIFLFDWFAALGFWGRLVGLVITLAYFGVLNSSIGNGQTVGKRCFRTRTVDENNNTIGLGRSLFRATILVLPWYLNGAPFLQRAPTWALVVASAIIFGIGGATVYLLVFNRRNRRAVHDLFARTRVIRADLAPPVAVRPTWKGHFVILSGFAVALLALGAFISSLIKSEMFGNLLAVQQAVLKQPGVSTASVFEGSTFFTSVGGEPTTTTQMNIGVSLTRRPDDYDRFADEIIGTVLELYPGARTKDRVTVVVQYGYDIGIARWSVDHSFNFTPAEWQQRLDSRGAPQT